MNLSGEGTLLQIIENGENFPKTLQTIRDVPIFRKDLLVTLEKIEDPNQEITEADCNLVESALIAVGNGLGAATIKSDMRGLTERLYEAARTLDINFDRLKQDPRSEASAVEASTCARVKNQVS